jgi:hypothetical protein
MLRSRRCVYELPEHSPIEDLADFMAEITGSAVRAPAPVVKAFQSSGFLLFDWQRGNPIMGLT